jgi:hypothetical protein
MRLAQSKLNLAVAYDSDRSMKRFAFGRRSIVGVLKLGVSLAASIYKSRAIRPLEAKRLRS